MGNKLQMCAFKGFVGYLRVQTIWVWASKWLQVAAKGEIVWINKKSQCQFYSWRSVLQKFFKEIPDTWISLHLLIWQTWIARKCFDKLYFRLITTWRFLFLSCLSTGNLDTCFGLGKWFLQSQSKPVVFPTWKTSDDTLEIRQTHTTE